MTVAQRRSGSFLSNPKVQERLDDILTPLATFAVLLVIWQIFSSLPGATLPSPVRVIQETWILILYPFYDRGGTDVGLFWQVFNSLQRVAIGYSLAAIVGISLGIAVGMNRRIAKGLDPIFHSAAAGVGADCAGSPTAKPTRCPVRHLYHGDLAHLD
jgi:bicarbonate transport system permease protein